MQIKVYSTKEVHKQEVKEAKKKAARRFKGFSIKVNSFAALGSLSKIFNT